MPWRQWMKILKQTSITKQGDCCKNLITDLAACWLFVSIVGQSTIYFFFYKFCLIVSKLKVKREGYIKVWLDGYCWNIILSTISNFTSYTFYIYETKKEDLRSYIQEHSICWSALRIFNKCYDIKVISIALLMPV